MKDPVANKTLVEKWINNHMPDGLSKLALKCGVSPSTINKIRAGIAPKRSYIRAKICRALKVKEEELFPTIQNNGEAS